VLEFDALQSVSGLTIRNGYDKNSDIYGKNSGVKDVELRFSTRDRLETTLKDDPASQHVALSRPIQAKILDGNTPTPPSTKCSSRRCALCDCLGFACAAF